MKRIFIVDDHPLMRKGVELTLKSEPSLQICGQAETAEEAQEKIMELKPDVAIVDISLPGQSGLELVKDLHAWMPELHVLVVSRHDEELYAERAIRAGAKGYIMKLEAGDVLVKAIRRVLNGGIYVSDKISDRLLLALSTGVSSEQASPLELLSDRELEVFELIGNGVSTREIAERLHLSVKTIESYRARIKNKLDIEHAVELVQQAVTWVEQERMT